MWYSYCSITGQSSPGRVMNSLLRVLKNVFVKHAVGKAFISVGSQLQGITGNI